MKKINFPVEGAAICMFFIVLVHNSNVGTLDFPKCIY